MPEQPLVVYAADVGKDGNVGWARTCGEEWRVGYRLEPLVKALKDDVCRGSVAIGLECPLFLPVAPDACNLLQRRINEPLPWSAGAGPSATTAGLVTLIWLLGRISTALEPDLMVFTDGDAFAASSVPHRLYVWEACVSQRPRPIEKLLGQPTPKSSSSRGAKWELKDDSHHLFDMADALTAVRAFVTRATEPSDVTLPAGAASLSLVRVAAIHAGLPTSQLLPQHLPLVRKVAKPDWEDVPKLLRDAGLELDPDFSLKQCFRVKDRRK